jgi:predicted DNA-binding transcriptional regulator YafY
MFAFSRIKNAALTKHHFTIPEDFNAHDYFDKEMGVWASSRTPQTVELLFDKEIGTYALDRDWHSGQTVEEQKDGSVYISFKTNQMAEVLRFVLGQGHTVKALGPAELVERVKAEIEKMRGMYGDDVPPTGMAPMSDLFLSQEKFEKYGVKSGKVFEETGRSNR